MDVGFLDLRAAQGAQRICPRHAVVNDHESYVGGKLYWLGECFDKAHVTLHRGLGRVQSAEDKQAADWNDFRANPYQSSVFAFDGKADIVMHLARR